MRNIRFAPLLICAFILSGCASLGPTYKYAKDSTSAVLRGKFPNMLKVAAGGEAPVFFESIDGFHIMPNIVTGDVREVFAAPGKRSIGIGIKAGIGPLLAGHAIIEMNLEPNHAYRFLGMHGANGLSVQVWDETSGPDSKVLLKETTVPVSEVTKIMVL